MSKTNIVRYKVSRQTQIFSLAFNEFRDGCRTFNNAEFNGMHTGIVGIGTENARVIHRNDNAAINPRINEFNNIVNGLPPVM